MTENLSWPRATVGVTWLPFEDGSPKDHRSPRSTAARCGPSLPRARSRPGAGWSCVVNCVLVKRCAAFPTSRIPARGYGNGVLAEVKELKRGYEGGP